jgi:hypothetical protein
VPLSIEASGALQPFAALTDSKIDEAALSFEWSAQLYTWRSDGTNTALAKRMRALSVSGVLGLAAATGEWLAFRLRRHAVDARFSATLRPPGRVR